MDEKDSKEQEVNSSQKPKKKTLTRREALKNIAIGVGASILVPHEAWCLREENEDLKIAYYYNNYQNYFSYGSYYVSYSRYTSYFSYNRQYFSNYYSYLSHRYSSFKYSSYKSYSSYSSLYYPDIDPDEI